MEIFSRLGRFADDRLLFNIIALHAVLGGMLLVSALLRWLIGRGIGHLAQATGWQNLDQLGRRLRTGLFWSTIGLMALTVMGSVGYHLAGRHIRHDVRGWLARLTWTEIWSFSLAVIELAVVVVIAWLARRQIRRGLPLLEKKVAGRLGGHREEYLHRCFVALERYLLILLGLAVVWCAGKIVGLSRLAGAIDDIVFMVLVTLSVAHLLTLSCHALSRGLAAWGDRYLAQSKFRRYWERMTRLFPLGERCFELAVYLSAGTLCIHELRLMGFIVGIGSRLVMCIGIFFGTRVIIELSQVLLNDAFGMYQEEPHVNQKGQTLVPLLHSVCQYVFYFGCALMMLGALGVDTGPILAGAGILGLAGGLGAQSLVTDVVSGFFILFESHYLVGDYVKIGEAAGRVEAVSIRCTHIRDEQGRVHIIPNGQIKGVINYSKDYVGAEVDMVVPVDSNLDEIFKAMADAGRRLRQTRPEVLGETAIKGLVDLTPTTMTVRAVTRVQPGTHALMQSEYRRYLRQVLDEQKTARPASRAA